MGWEWGAGSRRRELDGREPPVHAGTSAGTPGKGRGGGSKASCAPACLQMKEVRQLCGVSAPVCLNHVEAFKVHLKTDLLTVTA